MKNSIIFFLITFLLISCSKNIDEENGVFNNRSSSLSLLQIDSNSQYNGIYFSTDAEQNLFLIEHFIAEANASPYYEGIEIVGNFDYFFAVGSGNDPSSYFPYDSDGINLPSNFSLVMSDETHLRVLPNNNFAHHQLIGIFEKQNINIIGGHLHGERISSHININQMPGNLLMIRGGQNINISGTKFYECNGNGIEIGSSSHFNINTESYTNPSSGSSSINIQDCLFEKNRKSGINITDVDNASIIGSDFIDNGKDYTNSIGLWPASGINIEGDRQNPPLTNYPRNIKVINNSEHGSKTAGILASVTDHVFIEGNTINSGIGLGWVDNCSVINNVLIREGTGAITGISSGPSTNGIQGLVLDIARVHNNLISNNYIKNFDVGIDLMNSHDCVVSENNIFECLRGITIHNLKEYEILDNIIDSANHKSQGIVSINGSYLDEVLIQRNIITLSAFWQNSSSQLYPLRFSNINRGTYEGDFRVYIKQNTTKSRVSSLFSNVGGEFSVILNNFQNGLRFINCGNPYIQTSPIKIAGNSIIPTARENGLYIQSSSNMIIESNIVDIGEDNQNRCILAFQNSNLSFHNNRLINSKNLCTFYIYSNQNCSFTNNIGIIGTIQNSPCFLKVNGYNNTYNNNFVNDTNEERNCYSN